MALDTIANRETNLQWRTKINALIEGANSVKSYGAVGDGVTDDTDAIQDALDAGGLVTIPQGTYMVSTLVIKSGTYVQGYGYDTTILKQIEGTNDDMIVSDGFGETDISKFGISNLELNGNYFTSAWNAEEGTTGNTSGGGLKLQGYSGIIDIGITNVAGIGAYFAETNAGEASANSDYISTVSIVGKDFGKEGILIEGPNDWLLKKAWIGRAGILPRPSAETTIAESDIYTGEPVDGIVIDGANIEIGDVHVYACWSGTGFRTRNTVRLTKGGRVISESSRSQVNISSATYGSAFFDIRNFSLLHPNWTEAVPEYTAPDPVWDGATIAARDFAGEITVKRTITATKRVVGSTAVVVSSGSQIVMRYSNSTAPTGDAEAGSLYSGNAVLVTGKGASIDATIMACNGKGIVLQGEGCNIRFAARDGIGGAAIERDAMTNSMRGNTIVGSIVNCDLGFNSVGTPMSERVSLSMELDTGEVPFDGDAPDLARGQQWDIAASVNNVEYTTRQWLSAALDASSTSAQTVVLNHNFLYTPDYREIQLTIDDRSTPSTAYLDYLCVNAIDATTITVGYKFATTDTTPAANIRVNARLG